MANKQNRLLQIPLILLAAVALVVIGGIVTVILLNRFHPDLAQACGEKKGGIRICLSASKSHASAADEITLTTVIMNSSLTPAKYTFSSGCTGPGITYNGDEEARFRKSLSTMCTQAFEEVTIWPLSSKLYSKTISGSELKDGSNTAQADWQNYTSNTITIVREPVSSESLASQFKTCQNQKDDIEYDQIPSYCESISIIQRDYLEQDIGYTCTEWKTIVAKANLTLPCTSVMDIGVAYVYVPRNDPKLDEYKKSLKNLPEIAD